jgi:zinc finger protein 830
MSSSSSGQDLKSMMSEKLKEKQRVESPFAKYNSIGQLTCIICNQIVKSELMWTAHVNSRSHIDNKNNLKAKLTNEVATNPITAESSKSTKLASSSSGTFKRPYSVIISNSSTTTTAASTVKINAVSINSDQSGQEATEVKKQRMDNVIKKTSSIDLNKLSADVDQVSAKGKEKELIADIIEENNKAANISEPEAAHTSDLSLGEALPEGFFDDKELDAKVRGQSRAENLEAEYEEFKKIIQSEQVKSDIIIEKDDEQRDVDRDLQEVDELIDRWSKIEDLHKQREAILRTSKNKQKMNTNERIDAKENEDETDVDLENIMSLEIRSKKIL